MNRNLLHSVAHRIVGARGAVSLFPDSSNQSSPCFLENNQKDANFGKPCTLSEIANHRLVFLGEIHATPEIVAFQRAVQQEMATSSRKLHVVMEHFSFPMQSLLDDYMADRLSFEQLVQAYTEIGTEGHTIEAYRELLEDAKKESAASSGKIQLHAGFVPRTLARTLLRDGQAVAFQAANQWLPPNLTQLEGTEMHYSLFESLISGRSFLPPLSLQTEKDDSMVLPDTAPEASTVPSDRFRGIFQAQLLKDVAMAHKVSQLLQRNLAETATARNEKVLVLVGNGHVLHYCGVPERVCAQCPEIAKDTCVVVSQSTTLQDMTNHTAIVKTIQNMHGPEGSNPADYIYIFRDERLLAKQETIDAYDKVGETANQKGNRAKALAIMQALKYTTEQIACAGPDACNFQGVGNPHIHARIQSGDRVLDIGSGLGVDSFIAGESTGERGKVIGIDISQKEVEYSQARAIERGIDIRFAAADMEKIPLPDDCIDVVISNGAFCLAPDKRKAFAEVFRVLKPGGRISICTTTMKHDRLDTGISWPICMRMFITKSEIEPMCEHLGFVDVVVDDSDGSMTMELPEEVTKGINPARNRVHVGSKEFQHLEDYDMDRLCSRVCIVARKPKSNELRNPVQLVPKVKVAPLAT